MMEEIKTQEIEEKDIPVTEEKVEETEKTQSKTSEEIKDKLQNVADTMLQKANDSKKPKHIRAILYILAVILGGIGYIFSGHGDAILEVIESLINSIL